MASLRMSDGEGTRSARTVALFGGSFNPPHVAHVMACLYVLQTECVDEVWVVPCFRHPFEKQLASFDDRLEMCSLAMEALGSRVAVSTIERDIASQDGTPSRTLDTLEALASRFPESSFRLVIGADILRERGKWHRWEAIEQLAPPIVLGRQGYLDAVLPKPSVALPAISSTHIRTCLSRGEPVEHLVPRRVLEYVCRRRLYLSL